MASAVGWSVERSEPRSGERIPVRKTEFYRPLRGLWLLGPVPTAYAVGYCLPPLRGCLKSRFQKLSCALNHASEQEPLVRPLGVA